MLSRDGFRCAKCGRAGKLEAHHIEPVHIAPELAYDVGNGLTLCRACHIDKSTAANTNPQNEAAASASSEPRRALTSLSERSGHVSRLVASAGAQEASCAV
ncbi:HNH endonuclease [Candidatus Poriferisodalis sp.]|uniref:HNH endonuclease n=1 Tax=Candidatus Poriferisodalis sp. TaxID=3101277 RepID=UPI003B5CD096